MGFIQLLVLWLPPKGDGVTLLLRDSLKMTTKTVSLTLSVPLLLLHPSPTPPTTPMSTTQLPLLSKLLRHPKLRLRLPLFSPMLLLMSILATLLPTPLQQLYL